MYVDVWRWKESQVVEAYPPFQINNQKLSLKIPQISW